MQKSAKEFNTDVDIIAEEEALKRLASGFEPEAPRPNPLKRFGSGKVRLTLIDGKFHGTRETAELLAEIGGSSVVKAMTEKFYLKCFADPYISQFIQNTDDPHAERLANWIVEKMGGEGQPWSTERLERSKCPVHVRLGDGSRHVVHDRTSAHVAAWFSPKRDDEVMGERFKLHDARIWMRLMFWSAREVGLLEQFPRFQDWYVQFIAHFVAVYERGAPGHALESCQWSANSDNTERYLSNGLRMEDIKQYY